MLSLWRLEPFAGALENAGVVDQDGRPLSRNLNEAGTDTFEQQIDVQIRRRAAEIMDFFAAEAGLRRTLRPGERQRMLDQLLRQVSEERGDLLQEIAAATAPYRLPNTWDERADLIVRWLVLQAYAQLPGFGAYPGSPPTLAIAGDPRIRIVGAVGDIETNPAVARADDIALRQQLFTDRHRRDPSSATQDIAQALRPPGTNRGGSGRWLASPTRTTDTRLGARGVV
ncbi:MAG: hypothetical protein AB1609_19695 [Bacillota bacterium]